MGVLSVQLNLKYVIATVGRAQVTAKCRNGKCGLRAARRAALTCRSVLGRLYLKPNMVAMFVPHWNKLASVPFLFARSTVCYPVSVHGVGAASLVARLVVSARSLDPELLRKRQRTEVRHVRHCNRHRNVAPLRAPATVLLQHTARGDPAVRAVDQASRIVSGQLLV